MAPVFFALLFAIIETATMFFASQVLETMTQDSARQIMTGQAQNGALSATDFHDNVVCPLIPALFTCTSVFVDVESFAQFCQRDHQHPDRWLRQFHQQHAV